MKNGLLMLVAAALLFAQTAFAKEAAVLLPVTGAFTPVERAELAQAVLENLAARYEVVHGEEVDRFVKKTFQEESKKKDCDEANCYRRIAAQFSAEKIIALRISPVAAKRYFVMFNIYDVPTGDMTVSQKGECVDCNFEKLIAFTKKISEPNLKQ